MMEPIEIPIDGILDLHAFHPKALRDLLDDYLTECQKRGIFEVRLIHGKGKGVQRARVRSLLSADPRVRAMRAAPEDEGGWGATLVFLNGADK
jgi:DNA-nicking Smr family endonuclease